MITAKAWSGKHYAVYGLARSGQATVRALVASGARVTAWDEKAEARAQVEGAELLDLATADLSQFDILVVSPGVPLNTHPLAKRARDAGLEIIGDIELFACARPELPPHKVVGITGTNGKSTTTALVHHILQTAGVPTTMGGNIGLPILAQDPLPEGGVYVLELSSYQIDLTQSLDCEVAVLLNITPDHLDRYGSFEAYAASKARLFEMQSPHRLAVVDYRAEAEEDVLAEAEDPIIQFIDDVALSEEVWPALSGHHNLQNARAAWAACEQLGLSESTIAEALRSYPGLPHRMERVREVGGVLFVNDSKATNAEAAAPALAAYPHIRWIVGGQAKTMELGDTAGHLDHLVHAYTIGEAGPMFARLLRERGVPVTESETLENAVKGAAADSQAGEVVLLSPACASFDQFRDFEARGDAFKALVGAL
ncbi:UDP-N-acetylmuramoyl-L-alanine--D-glutamate ligase [Sphingomonas sp. KRR8]|uniref:UDP-N-acetylmuramoyl-L-alanine--D-glutamate ligase n=1 Tax=Sphingomonas sp. KRR8 TaxID=2942996 RepID=UPI0020223CFD|nr:UDP-N-acetylmuramoyl-L-alanine--D-glutamate ligase [Sphingomonas sp. KRR8]URD59651.1 UDP-N-acetylmuramoyl-L-alanine--D-glutamate ligase [Sphingomonas sp. KRR8]